MVGGLKNLSECWKPKILISAYGAQPSSSAQRMGTLTHLTLLEWHVHELKCASFNPSSVLLELSWKVSVPLIYQSDTSLTPSWAGNNWVSWFFTEYWWRYILSFDCALFYFFLNFSLISIKIGPQITLLLCFISLGFPRMPPEHIHLYTVLFNHCFFDRYFSASSFLTNKKHNCLWMTPSYPPTQTQPIDTDLSYL